MNKSQQVPCKCRIVGSPLCVGLGWVGGGTSGGKASLITGRGVSGVPRGVHSSLAQPWLSNPTATQDKLVWSNVRTQGSNSPLSGSGSVGTVAPVPKLAAGDVGGRGGRAPQRSSR
jgi:hypothetical protein